MKVISVSDTDSALPARNIARSLSKNTDATCINVTAIEAPGGGVGWGGGGLTLDKSKQALQRALFTRCRV